MILAKIRIENNVLTVSDQKRLVSGSKGDNVDVSFGAGWDGLNKHIVLSASDVEVETRNPSGAVEVHCSLMEHSGRFLSVSAYGTDSAGKRVLTTEYVNIGYIYQGTRIMEKCPPVPGWSDGIEADVDRALKTAESVRRDADNGVFDGTDGFSPTANVTETPDGATISITDQAGATSVTIRNGKDGKEQDISGKQNWATIKLPSFPEAATEESLHAWVNANHKGPDRKWLVESSNPDWAKLVDSLGGVPEGVSPDDSAFILLEIPYSEAGPEMLCVQYVLRNKHSVWHQNQYATYSTSTPTWHKSGWYRLDDSASILEEAKDYADGKVVTIEIEDRGGQDFWTRPVTTAREIIDMVNAGKEVRLSFYDTLTNTGDQLYAYETTDKGVPYFRRNVVKPDQVSRINIGVQYNGEVLFSDIPYTPPTQTCFATCTAAAAPPSSEPVTWYVPKTMPKPSANPGLLIDVFWANGRADGLGYDVSLVWGSEGGADNEVIVSKVSVADSLTGEYSIPAEGTVRYQLEESNSRKHWRYVGGDVIGKQFSSDTAAEIADKVVPGMELAYLPGMEIYLQLDRGNTADLMRLVPDSGPTLPVYGNGTGAKTGAIPAGYVLHLANAGDHWQIINAAGSPDAVTYTPQTLTPEQQTQARTNIDAISGKEAVEALCPEFSETAPVVTCQPVGLGYPFTAVKSHLIPQQSGSGDPSPENVRPFVPYERAELTRCGENIFNPDTLIIGKVPSLNNGNLVDADSSACTDFLPVESNYVLSGDLIDQPSQFYIFLYDKHKKFINALYHPKLVEVTKIGGYERAKYARLRFDGYKRVENIYYGNRRSYVPYTGETFTAPLPAETYGGEMDWLKGTLVGKYKKTKEINGNLNWNFYDGIGYVFGFATDVNDNLNQWCDSYPSGDKDVSGDGLFVYLKTRLCAGAAFVRKYGGPDGVKAQLNSKPAYIVYELGEPIPSDSISPSAVPTPIPGTNTLYSVGGDNTVEGREVPYADHANLEERIKALENHAVPTV